jgi:hypothetical protein
MTFQDMKNNEKLCFHGNLLKQITKRLAADLKIVYCVYMGSAA